MVGVPGENRTAEEIRDCEDTQCPYPDCEDRYWWVFLTSSLILFVGGLLAIILLRLIVHLACRSKVHAPAQAPTPRVRQQQRGAFGKEADPEIPWMTAVRDWASALISAQTRSGKLLVSIVKKTHAGFSPYSSHNQINIYLGDRVLSRPTFMFCFECFTCMNRRLLYPNYN